MGGSRIIAVVLALAVTLAGNTQFPAHSTVALAAPANPIVAENALPGTTAWQLDSTAQGSPLKATHHEIEGYGSLTSVNVGGQIAFMVSLSSPAQYTLDIYRMGYYPTGTNPDGSPCAGPCGGRLMQQLGPLPGVTQAACPVSTASPTRGMVECQWPAAATLTIPATWTTGSYLGKLRRIDSGMESFLTFVVRDDTTPADLVFSLEVTTWQAYNFWGGNGNSNAGANLYGAFDDVTLAALPGPAAQAVSFDRPYLTQGETDGAGQFFLYDYPLIRWLERQGYNVTYATDLDIETNAGLLLGRKAFLNAGHDEYYSQNMRDHLQGYLNAGAHMAFLGANAIYQRVRFADAASGQPLRRMICPKDRTVDPTLVRWRDLVPPQPENALIGVMSNGVATTRPFEVADATSWIYAGTGLVNYAGGEPITAGNGQNAIAGLVGPEWDVRAANDPALAAFVAYEPPGLSRSPTRSSPPPTMAWPTSPMLRSTPRRVGRSSSRAGRCAGRAGWTTA